MSVEIGTKLNITKPDDWHLHLRDGDMMSSVLPYSAKHFARAIVMPNLKTPIRTIDEAKAYKERIKNALPDGIIFEPLMTSYLTDNTDPDELENGYKNGIFFAAKLYPAGATTNSEYGVTDIQAISFILDRLQNIGMPLCIHGEIADPSVDFFDREAVFIDRILSPMRRSFPKLKIVMEHLTTKVATEYIASEAQNGNIGATITPHHLLINRNAIFEKGINPHHFCLPVVKREEDRQALIQAATSGASMFFAGTDSAPHPRLNKENKSGFGGIFTAPNAISIYAEIFDKENAINNLSTFLSSNGSAFYNVDENKETIEIEKLSSPQEKQQPIKIKNSDDEIVVFPEEHQLSWRVNI